MDFLEYLMYGSELDNVNESILEHLGGLFEYDTDTE